MNPVLALRGATFAVGGQALLGPLDLEVLAGRRLIVLGPNGAGKSLLLRLCHGLIAPTAGEVAWLGDGGGDARRHAQAMVFQHALPMRRSALADVEFALAARGIARAERRGRAMDSLQTFGLGALAHRPARVMSGGERQRVAIARAFLADAPILILAGELDSVTPAFFAKQLAALNEGLATVHVFPGANHLNIIRHGAGVTVAGFLAKMERGAATLASNAATAIIP